MRIRPLTETVFVERLGGRDRVLARHRVDDQQRFGRLEALLEISDLRHHLLVDMEAPRRVDDHDRGAYLARLPDTVLDDRSRRHSSPLRVDLDRSLLAELL